MTTYVVPFLCRECVWLFKGRGVVKDARWSCKAFLNGIPDEIYYNEVKHSQPLPNQKNKIVFEAVA